MKKHLLYLFLVLGFTQLSQTLFAAVPTINYAPANPYTVGTPMSLSPTVGNGVSAFAYGAATVLGTGAPLNAPWGLGTDNAGNVYVANSAGNNILEYSSSGAYIGIFITGTAPGPTLTTPVGIVFDAAGNAYVMRQSGIVYKYSSTGTYIGLISSGSGTGYGIAIDKAGNLYWSDYANGYIDKYTAATSTITAPFINLGIAFGPAGVAVDGNGNIYFTDIANTYRAYKYSSTGAFISQSAALNNPYGISVDASGNVYIEDTGASRVYVYNPAFTTLITTLTVTAGSRGITTDSKGNLYVTSTSAKTLTRYSPVGGYFLTGTLQPGLTFDSTTGIISGTPTSTVSGGPYTVTAYNASGAGTSNTFNLTFQAGPPTINYTGSPYSYTVGTAIPTLTPTTTNSPTSFTISPNLTTNTGLSFDPATGIISGNPTTASGPLTYTITAINANPTHGTATISIQVYPKVPTVVYTGSPFTFGVGTPIVTLTPATTNSPTSFTISPNLTTNTGLTFDTSTGIISGTPTTASAATTYTVTAINANPTHGTTTISIKVLGPPTVSYAGSPYVYTVGTLIPTLTPTTSNSPTSFTISPNLTTNTGLIFDPSTGIISGTPTAASVAVTYTISAFNISSTPGTTTISVTVYPKVPTVAYTGSPFTYGVGTPIVTLTPATTNSPTSFTISPNLTANTGLTFDTSTGIISGTPTTASAATTYTITAINANPTHGTATISIKVLGPPTVAYAGSPYFYTVGTAIPTLTPTTTNSPTSFTISPDINANTGLTFNTATGVISGTPTAASVAVTYTISAFNIASTPGTTTISVTVYPKVPTVAYTGSPFTFGVGVPISTLTPATTNSPTSFTISPNLTANTGLTFDPATGIISGTPTTASGAVTYTITAINANPTHGTTTITVTVLDKPTVAYTGSPYVYIVGGAITSLTPATTNSPTSFSISPNLTANTGLTFNTTTGVISGTPTTISPSTDYTITAYNVAGTGTTTINVTINATPPPTIAYTGSPFTYTVGMAIPTLTPTTTYSPTSYSISPNLTANTGLTFNTVTGVISGTPTTASAFVTYTVTAFNSAGSASTTIDVQVYPAVPTVAYTGSPFTFGLGTAIATLTPATTNSPTSFTISPNLTANTGLIFNTTTGVISGTPTTASAAVTYTITAYNANPTPGSTTISITVLGPPTVAYAGSPYFYTVGTIIPTLTPTTTNSPTSFTISPSLNANTGLTFNTTTGVISGTPTTASPAVTYTISAFNASSTPGTTTISITVYPKGPTVAYTGSPFTYGVTVPITSLTPATTGSPTIYTISPNLTANTGLTFNTSTGVISGTPTTQSAAVTYTISAFNANPTPGTTTISITVVPKATITYPTPNSYTVGTPIPTLSPTIGGGAVTPTPSYGTGTVILTTGANNPYGMAVDPSGNVYVTNFTANTVTEFSPAGVVISTFGSSANLSGPIGIVFDSSGNAYVLNKTSSNVVKFTGGVYGGVIITGLSTPTGIAIDGSNNIYVGNNNGAPGGFFTPKTSYITKYPTSGGAPSLQFSTNGAGYPINAGIAVDGAGNIYVTDNDGGSFIDSYTATGAYIAEKTVAGTTAGLYIDGSGNAFITTSGSGKAIVDNSTFTTTYVTETGFSSPRGIVTDKLGNLYVSDYTAGTVTKYPPLTGFYISGALPPGLSFNSTNGNITGVPSASFSGSYTVTAYNIAGAGTSNTFTINCILTAPILSYNPNSYTFAVNTAITPIDITNTGGPVSTSPGYGPGIVILTAANGLNHPWGIAIDPSGSVYAVNNAYTTINGLSPITKWSGGVAVPFTLTPNPPTNNPIGVVSDSFGNVYILTPTGLYKYNSAGVYQSSAAYTGIVNGLGIAIDAGNNIFVSEGTPSAAVGTADKVLKFPTTGGAGNVLFTSSYPFGITGGIAVDSQDNVYPVDNVNSPSVDKYDQLGNRIGVFSFIGSSYGDAVDGSNNVFLAGNGQIAIYNTDGDQFASIPNLTDPRGVVVDAQGDVFVSDYTNNTVTEYKPIAGYILTGTLPPGLTFDNTTGQFAGTPTTIFPAVTLTVTGYNASGMSSTQITFTCGNANYWHGITAGNTDWNTAANWSAGTVPLATDVAYIGTTYGNSSRFQYLPTISNGETPTIAAVVMGSANKYNVAPGINTTGNGTLNVTTNITFQGDNYSENNYTALLQGTGTIKANSLIISTAYNDFESYTLSVTSSISKLQLSGSLSLIAGVDNTNDYSLPVFNVTGGITSVATTIQTSNVNNSASSISTITVKTAGTLQLAGSTALSGLSPYGVNTLSFKNAGATVEYSGLANQTVYTDVAATGLPTGPSYQNLKFSGTGVKTPNGTATSNLNVAGDFTNTLANDPADYVNLTNTIVNFNGTTQALAGGAGPTYSATSTIATPNPAGTVFKTVNFSGIGTKTIASGGIVVASTGVLTMSGSGAVLAAGGFLTLNSDANSTATVPVIPTGSSITGNVNVQRWVTGGAGYRGYRLMSSPVNGKLDGNPTLYSLNYLNNSTWIKGTSGVGFSGGVGTDNVFLYRENLMPSNATFTSGNYNGINSMGATSPTYSYPVDGNTGSATFNIPVGDGILFFFRGDKLVAPLTTEAVSTYTPTSAITIATGTLNQGAIAVKDWYTSSSPYLGFTYTTGNAAVRGYNLVGNPYASTIDLTTASTTAGAGLQISAPIGGKGVEGNFYELNPATQNFDVWSNSLNTGTNSATKYIASGQGFFVVADTTNQTLTFNESAKVGAQNTGPALFMATGGGVTAQNIRSLRTNPAMINNNGNADQHIRLKLAMDTIHKDDIFINFDPSAKSGYVANEDATYKQGSGKVSLSSFSSDNVSLAINSMPLPAVSQTIGLKVYATADGAYSLNMSELKNIPDMYDVWLMDAYKKDSLNMRKSANYSFNLAHADTNSFGSKRFTLVIRQNPALATRLLTFTAAKATNGAQMTWKTVNEQNYTNFTVQRSTDGGNTFSNLGALVSNSAGSYSFVDNNPVVPADSYRLQITDVNGNITYSNIVPLQYSNLSNNIAATTITIFPNPTVSMVNIAINQTFNTSSFDIQVVNSSGVVVKKATSAAPSWQSDVSGFIPGTYVIQVVKHSDQTVVGRGTFVKL